MNKLAFIALLAAVGASAVLIPEHSGEGSQTGSTERGYYSDALVQDFMARRLWNSMSETDPDSRSSLLDSPLPSLPHANLSAKK
jgi:hypothetical protein